MRHEVDFEQLKIENEQLRDRLEEKNQELLKLKLSSGNSTQILNSYKVSLYTYDCKKLCLVHFHKLFSSKRFRVCATSHGS